MAISAERLAQLRAKAASSKLLHVTLPPKGVTNETAVAAVQPAPVVVAVDICDTLGDMSSMAVVNTAVATASSSDSSPSTAQSVDLTPQQFNVVEKIERISSMLKSQNPGIEGLLKQVHTALHKDPELMHFLTPEQIGAVVGGCLQVAQVVIVAAAVKKTTTASGKKLSQLTLSDI